MAERADNADFFWVDPPLRGQLDILTLRIPKKLQRTVLKFPYRVTVDTAFESVIAACAEENDTRQETWINAAIRDTFITLHYQGHAHSIEVWQDDTLVGGLYGLAVGGVFCGESMFSRAADASKIALVHLCARLHRAGFTVLDTQFVNDHLKQFGVYEIARADYRQKLAENKDCICDFGLKGDPLAHDELVLITDYFNVRKHQTT